MATPREQKKEEKMEELEERIKDLENWKAEKMRQQISQPLDESSKNIINQI